MPVPRTDRGKTETLVLEERMNISQRQETFTPRLTGEAKAKDVSIVRTSDPTTRGVLSHSLILFRRNAIARLKSVMMPKTGLDCPVRLKTRTRSRINLPL